GRGPWIDLHCPAADRSHGDCGGGRDALEELYAAAGRACGRGRPLAGCRRYFMSCCRVKPSRPFQRFRRNPSMETSRQGGLRVLFADDEVHLRDLMQMELPRLGHEVTVCSDGPSALRALERGLYDAALLDLRMPGLTGIEVLGQIKQLSPETQVI